ncbi:MAG TPA: hypothetical protein VMJ65_24125 [Solirubrobacteraceae bacterium]|nr:hypothetical protein [Solirubrobacteraceae bacterium]
MDFRQLDRGELIAVLGGAILGLSVFLAWYTLGDRYTVLGNCRGPNTSCTAWNSLMILRFLLLIAAIAPAVLAWIILRGHALSWPRGEMTAIIAIAALTFTVFRGLIDKPGTPPGEIGISVGWWIGLLGGLLILVGSVARTKESMKTRKPPGLP